MNLKLLKQLVGYKGRKEIKTSTISSKLCLCSCWDGGSKDTWVFVHRSGQTVKVPDNGTPYNRIADGVLDLGLAKVTFEKFYYYVSPEQMPDDVILVCSSVLCGKQCAPHIYVKPGQVL